MTTEASKIEYAALHEPIIPVLQLLLQQTVLPPNAWVLDLASGVGEKLPLLRESLSDAQIAACDWDRIALSRAQKDSAMFVAGDVHSLPFQDQSFDLVVCVAALGLFADSLSALREMHRVLRHDGRVLIITAEQRWARVTDWPPALVDTLTTLWPAHADHAADVERIPLEAGFTRAASFAVPLTDDIQPVAAALSLNDWTQLAPLIAELSVDQQHACEIAYANAEIELCELCLAAWLDKG